MNQRTPADPPPAVGKKGLTSAFAPGIYVGAGEPSAEPSSGQASVAPPRKSFFRGVAVGIAIMIPIWTWLIILLLR
jgi:hypothetical protein